MSPVRQKDTRVIPLTDLYAFRVRPLRDGMITLAVGIIEPGGEFAALSAATCRISPSAAAGLVANIEVVAKAILEVVE